MPSKRMNDFHIKVHWSYRIYNEQIDLHMHFSRNGVGINEIGVKLGESSLLFAPVSKESLDIGYCHVESLEEERKKDTDRKLACKRDVPPASSIAARKTNSSSIARSHSGLETRE